MNHLLASPPPGRLRRPLLWKMSRNRAGTYLEQGIGVATGGVELEGLKFSKRRSAANKVLTTITPLQGNRHTPSVDDQNRRGTEIWGHRKLAMGSIRELSVRRHICRSERFHEPVWPGSEKLRNGNAFPQILSLIHKRNWLPSRLKLQKKKNFVSFENSTNF